MFRGNGIVGWLLLFVSVAAARQIDHEKRECAARVLNFVSGKYSAAAEIGNICTDDADDNHDAPSIFKKNWREYRPANVHKIGLELDPFEANGIELTLKASGKVALFDEVVVDRDGSVELRSSFGKEAKGKLRPSATDKAVRQMWNVINSANFPEEGCLVQEDHPAAFVMSMKEKPTLAHMLKRFIVENRIRPSSCPFDSKMKSLFNVKDGDECEGRKSAEESQIVWIEFAESVSEDDQDDDPRWQCKRMGRVEAPTKKLLPGVEDPCIDGCKFETSGWLGAGDDEEEDSDDDDEDSDDSEEDEDEDDDNNVPFMWMKAGGPDAWYVAVFDFDQPIENVGNLGGCHSLKEEIKTTAFNDSELRYVGIFLEDHHFHLTSKQLKTFWETVVKDTQLTTGELCRDCFLEVPIVGCEFQVANGLQQLTETEVTISFSDKDFLNLEVEVEGTPIYVKSGKGSQRLSSLKPARH